MQYTNLLDNADWFQSFDNTFTPVTSYTYGERTTANSANPRVARVFANDNPFGSGYCWETSSGYNESEYIISQINAYPKPTNANYYDGSTIEFWVKISSSFNGAELLKWDSFSGSTFLNLGINSTKQPYLLGRWFVTNGNQDASDQTILGQALSVDEWHLITYVSKKNTKYINSTTLGYGLENIIYVDGIEVARRTQNPNFNSSIVYYSDQFMNYMANGLEYGSTNTGEGPFSNLMPAGIKIANFAFWQNQAQSQKKIARRYMFNKTKKTVKQHTIDSNPYFYQTWDSFDNTNQIFDNQLGSGPAWGIMKSSDGMDWTVGAQEKRGISTVGKSGLETILPSSYYGEYIEALAASGNWSVDHWVKWDYTKQQFLTDFPANKPQALWYSGSAGLASFLIRLDPLQQLNFGDRFNNGGMTIHPQIINGFYLYDQLTDGDWHHIAKTFSYSGTTLTIRGYIDGVKLAQGIYTVTTPNNPTNSWTGANFYAGWPYAPASNQKTSAYFDNYAIYNRTLTDTEIADKYRNFAAVDYAVNHYNGQTWETTSTQKVWDGNDWILWSDASPTQWDGTSWVAI